MISEVYNCDCLEYMRSLPDKKLGQRYCYKPSVELDKIPTMLEGLGIHDYYLDNIIEMRVRLIVMNAEYVG